MDLRNRKGMTLVELLVALVAASLVMGAVYQVLLTNQRVYTVQRERIVGHQTVRAGTEILFSELREASPPEGDLLTLEEDLVEFRAMRSFGIACAINPSQSRVSVTVHGQGFEEGQTAFVFVDDDPDSMTDDRWVSSPVQSAADDSSACTQPGTATFRIQTLNLPDLASGDFDELRTGAAVRSAETFTYGVFQIDGDWYLGRRTATDDPVPLVGPLDGETGLRFEYLADDGTETTTPSDVRRIQVTLRTASTAVDRAGNAVADSLTTQVFLRN